MKLVYPTMILIMSVQMLRADTNVMSLGQAADLQTERFSNAGLDLAVVFEDLSILAVTKAEIMDDYRHTLGNLVAHGKTIVQRPQSSIGDKSMARFQAATFKGAHKKLPDGFEGDFGLIAEAVDGTEYLVIPKHLSDAYQSALLLKSEESEAFDKLKNFLNFMNGLQIAEIPAISDLLYLGNGAEKYRSELEGRSAAEFRKDYGGQRYKAPSLLDVVRGTGEMSGHLVTKLAVLNGVGDIQGELPLVYDASRWKIAVTVPGI